MIDPDGCNACRSYWYAEMQEPPCKITGWCPVYKQTPKNMDEK